MFDGRGYFYRTRVYLELSLMVVFLYNSGSLTALCRQSRIDLFDAGLYFVNGFVVVAVVVVVVDVVVVFFILLLFLCGFFYLFFICTR